MPANLYNEKLVRICWFPKSKLPKNLYALADSRKNKYYPGPTEIMQVSRSENTCSKHTRNHLFNGNEETSVFHVGGGKAFVKTFRDLLIGYTQAHTLA